MHAAREHRLPGGSNRPIIIPIDYAKETRIMKLRLTILATALTVAASGPVFAGLAVLIVLAIELVALDRLLALTQWILWIGRVGADQAVAAGCERLIGFVTLPSEGSAAEVDAEGLHRAELAVGHPRVVAEAVTASSGPVVGVVAEAVQPSAVGQQAQ